MYVVKEPLITFTFTDRMSPDGDIFTFKYPVHVMEKTASMELYVRDDKYTRDIHPDIENYTRKIFIQFLSADKDNIIFMDCITKKMYSCNMNHIVYQIIRVLGRRYNIVNPDMTFEQMLDRFKIEMLFIRDLPALYTIEGLMMYHHKGYDVNMFKNMNSSLFPSATDYTLREWDESRLDKFNEIRLDIDPQVDLSDSEYSGMAKLIEEYGYRHPYIKLTKLSDKLWIPSADNEVVVTTLSNIDTMNQYQKMLKSVSKKILTRNKL